MPKISAVATRKRSNRSVGDLVVSNQSRAADLTGARSHMKPWVGVAALLAALSLGVMIGRSSVSSTAPVEEKTKSTTTQNGRARMDAQGQAPRQASDVTRRDDPSIFARASFEKDEEQAENERQFHRSKSRELLSLLDARLNTFARDPVIDHPEAIVNSITEYLTGWTDATGRGSADVTAALSEEIEAKFCARAGADGYSQGSMMMYARVLRNLPELATQRSFDCFFERASSEDVVLWEGMDAWKASGLPRPAALDALARRATREQTRSRLSSKDDVLETQRRLMMASE